MQDEASWIAIFRQREAFWEHDGNPKRPHALLTSGRHSSGFFNSELVLEDPRLVSVGMQELLKELLESGLDTCERVDRVAGPALGAVTLTHSMASEISKTQHPSLHCLRAYCEKEGEGSDKKMFFKRTAIRPGEHVLLVEDVVTTGESVELVAEAVEAAGGVVLPFVGTLVNRSESDHVGEKSIIALVTKYLPTWTAGECPLCMRGSEAIRPKGAGNWARLNAEY